MTDWSLDTVTVHSRIFWWRNVLQGENYSLHFPPSNHFTSNVWSGKTFLPRQKLVERIDPPLFLYHRHKLLKARFSLPHPKFEGTKMNSDHCCRLTGRTTISWRAKHVQQQITLNKPIISQQKC